RGCRRGAADGPGRGGCRRRRAPAPRGSCARPGPPRSRPLPHGPARVGWATCAALLPDSRSHGTRATPVGARARWGRDGVGRDTVAERWVSAARSGEYNGRVGPEPRVQEAGVSQPPREPREPRRQAESSPSPGRLPPRPDDAADDDLQEPWESRYGRDEGRAGRPRRPRDPEESGERQGRGAAREAWEERRSRERAGRGERGTPRDPSRGDQERRPSWEPAAPRGPRPGGERGRPREAGPPWEPRRPREPWAPPPGGRPPREGEGRWEPRGPRPDGPGGPPRRPRWEEGEGPRPPREPRPPRGEEAPRFERGAGDRRDAPRPPAGAGRAWSPGDARERRPPRDEVEPASEGQPPRERWVRQWWRARPPEERPREPEGPAPAATISAERARELAQAHLAHGREGLFAQPPVPGALQRRQVWFVPLGRLREPGVVGEVVIDAATGEVMEARLP